MRECWKPLEEIVPVEVFRAEILSWAKRLGVEPKEIRIREMKHKWASCSTAGRLTFDRGLLKQPGPVRTLVILHELLHLRIPNHTKLFKALLSAYFHEKYPDSDLPELPTVDGGPAHGSAN
ncbi:M48 family metallopeptidase [Candidatus Bipolaricaulota bacterium]|nr:M48 family metallopeptidase [Candidatus Bipolaricaulota bacterium]